MIFNFPEPEKIGDRHDVLIKPELWAEVTQIAKDRRVDISKAINILLEGAIGEYRTQYKVQEVSVVVEDAPEPEKMPDEKPKAATPSGRWSRKHDCCWKCGRDDRKHIAKGLCVNCYSQESYKKTIKEVFRKKVKKDNNHIFVENEKSDDLSEQIKEDAKAFENGGDEMLYCSNNKCLFGRIKHYRANMVESEGKLYCSDDCVFVAGK